MPERKKASKSQKIKLNKMGREGNIIQEIVEYNILLPLSTTLSVAKGRSMKKVKSYWRNVKK